MELISTMSVKKGDKIKVSYTGTFENGEVFDATNLHNGELLEFQVGEQQVVKGFDNAVIGKELNEEFDVRIEPADGYGEYNDQAIQEIPKVNLPADMKPEVGMVLQLQHQHEDHVHNVLATVKKVEDDKIIIDLNHPLAGKVLNFKIKIEEIIN